MATGKRAVKGRKVTKSEVKINYDLVDIFERAFPGKTTKDIQVRNQLRPFISEPTVKFNFGQAVVREIRKRTSERGVDIDNAPFKKYPSSYTETDEFNIFKDSEKPNLKLTGDMMASIVATSKTFERSVIVEISDDLNVLKSFNHITGDTVKQRDFFGLPEKKDAIILKKIILDANKDNVLGTIESLVGDLQVTVTSSVTNDEGERRSQVAEISQDIVNELIENS